MTYSFYLKSWFLFLLCPLPSSKNPFNFFDGGGCVFVCVCVCVCVLARGGLFYKFDGPREEGYNDSRWNPTGGRRGGQENTILKGTSEMCCPLSVLLY